MNDDRLQWAIIEHAPILIVGLDRESGIVLFNRYAEELTGYRAEEVIGREWVSTFIPVERRQRTYQVWHDIVDHMRVDHRNQNEILTKAGERRLLDWSNMVLTEEGELRMVVSMGVDITERRQADADRARLMTAVEQVADAIAVTDASGAIQYVNPAFSNLTGYDREEVLGQNPRILKSGRQDLAFYEALWAAITAGRNWKGTIVNKRKDGSLYVEETTISPVRNEEGEIVNFVAVKRDISERLRMEEEREKLEERVRSAQRLEAVGRLAGGVAHDFNNLLNVILGYGDLALQQLHPQDPLRANLQQMIAAGQRAAALTRQLLAFSRRQALEPKVLNLNDLIRNLEKLLGRLIGEDIALELALAQDLGRVLADPGQVEQVIMNLVVNARDAMPDGGKLLIETANVELDEAYAARHPEVEPGQYVMLAVTDTGCGMTEAIMDRIFDPFFTTKDRDKGTGLGLSTVHGIVKQSGGSIWVYSEVGRGTTFKVYLPRTEMQPQRAAAQQAEVRPSEGGEHILVVEDEGSLRELMGDMLSRLGYRVTLAANGGEALLLVEEGLRPDLVITDVVMPHINGKQLVDRLRRTQPDLKVLYTSGYTANAIVHHGVLDPAMPFIQKPFGMQELSAQVQRALQTGGPGARKGE